MRKGRNKSTDYSKRVSALKKVDNYLREKEQENKSRKRNK